MLLSVSGTLDNKEFYSTALQVMVLNHIRESCTDGFDELVSTIRERIARWPYCALVRGLDSMKGTGCLSPSTVPLES